jgi:hypothetical protein
VDTTGSIDPTNAARIAPAPQRRALAILFSPETIHQSINPSVLYIGRMSFSSSFSSSDFLSVDRAPSKLTQIKFFRPAQMALFAKLAAFPPLAQVTVVPPTRDKVRLVHLGRDHVVTDRANPILVQFYRCDRILDIIA